MSVKAPPVLVLGTAPATETRRRTLHGPSALILQAADSNARGGQAYDVTGREACGQQMATRTGCLCVLGIRGSSGNYTEPWPPLSDRGQQCDAATVGSQSRTCSICSEEARNPCFKCGPTPLRIGVDNTTEVTSRWSSNATEVKHSKYAARGEGRGSVLHTHAPVSSHKHPYESGRGCYSADDETAAQKAR